MVSNRVHISPPKIGVLALLGFHFNIIDPALVVIASEVSDPFHMPDLPHAILDDEIASIFSPAPVGCHGGFALDRSWWRITAVVWVEGLVTRAHPQSFGRLEVTGNLDCLCGEGVIHELAWFDAGAASQDPIPDKFNSILSYEDTAIGQIHTDIGLLECEQGRDIGVSLRIVDVFVPSHQVLDVENGLKLRRLLGHACEFGGQGLDVDFGLSHRLEVNELHV